MKNKKTITALFLLTFSVSIVGFFFFLKENSLLNKKAKHEIQTEKNNGMSREKIAGMLPKVECSYASDKEAYQDAIKKANVNICGCVGNSKFQDICKDTTIDLALYNQAIDQLNSDLCVEIKEASTADACNKMVQSSVEHFKKEDPQYLAGVYATSHNEAAISSLEELLQSDPNNINNLVLLSLAYSEKALKEQEQGKDNSFYVNKSLEVITNAKKVSPNNSEVYRAEGYAYEIKPDIGLAIASYEKAIELDPKNFMAYAGKGHAESMIGVLNVALEDFKRAAELDVNNESSFIYANLCRLQSSRDDLLQDAIENCKIVADGNFDDPVFKSDSAQTLALIYIKSGYYSQAEIYLLNAKTLTPNDPNLYATFSKLSFFQKEYSQAQSWAERAIELSPTKAVSHLALANAFYMREEFNRAIDTAKKGVDLVSDDVSLLAPGKDAVRRDFYYTISHSYKHLGDSTNQKKYMGMADVLEDK